MASPIYTTDLVTLAIGSITVDAGTWDESSDAGWDGAGAMVDDSNLFYNGSACVSAQYTKSELGTIMYEHTASITVPTDGAILIHHLWAAPPALATLALGGVRIIVGNDFGIFYAWDISGSDFLPAPKGGWTNYAINPGIGSPDDTVGAPGTPYNVFGMAVDATAQARGNPNAVNAVRYGRCESRFTDGDGTNGYATFEGYGLIDSAIANKWSLLDPVEGGYKFQGLMSLGLAATSVDFRDANINISIANTIKVTSLFNAIEIHNASSNVEWTAINISALGTNSRGTFEMIDNATVAKTNCVFTDMSTFIYQSGATLTSSTYRRCDQVTQGSATFDACIFDSSTAAVSLVVNSLTDVTNCSFSSDGSNHAVNLGTITTDTSMNWNNYLSGYASANGSTGNEAILVSVDSGQTLTINVGDGYTTPYINNTGTGTVTVVTGQRTFALALNPAITSYEWRIYSVTAVGSMVGASELAGEESATSSSQQYTYTYSIDVPIAVQIISQPSNDYVEEILYFTLTDANQNIQINLTNDINN